MMGPGRPIMIDAETIMVPIHSPRAVHPARPTAALSPAPAACPTLTVTACAMPSGTMKVSAANWSAMAWAGSDASS